MPGATPADTAELLARSRDGDKAAFDHLYTRLYDDLRQAARGQLRRYRGGTLDTTTLVHEAYVRLVDERDVPWAGRAHFLAIAARAMRRAVVDHLRARNAQKRGGGRVHVTLPPDIGGRARHPETMITIDNALEELATFNERLVRVAECRLFGGLTVEETSGALGVSVRTIERDWQRARAWLQQELSD
ncbi:MAG: sigma-70 family RNA polymerase sigma factor [Gemmatimonadetes bacterium]|nr:sigma-70 family RNA polymerase sigma factor [Gemmatimonadota bacterium]NIQ55567.1 sigma-70 family RNA polymerase sigma factor [Gemmatimonadota bacterium]NIU75775.1 sigma-70 family RNA polymerase sigma factor [Gammaproteobacteria bacterium]NIX45422.1 sigma-70 family RNA polymerase sigma factor [Gemmatimonadota bacterium]NIY09709.1 sigma-70 family RNA polymerase sigma factor [Gemmatimonadota bacterium]